MLALACAALLPSLASAEQKTVWLCKPGLRHNPCAAGLETTRLSNNGKTALGEYTPKEPNEPKVDCFYVPGTEAGAATSLDGILNAYNTPPSNSGR